MKKQTKKPKVQNYMKHFTHLRLLNFILLFSLIGTLFLHFTLAALPDGMYGSYENDQVKLINQARSADGKLGVNHIECLNTVAENWAVAVANKSYFVPSTGTWYIEHNANLAANVDSNCGRNWTFLTENVGAEQSYPNDVLASSNYIMNGPAPRSFMTSAGHRANILDARAKNVGTGAYRLTKTSNGVTASVWFVVQVMTSDIDNRTPASVAVDPVGAAPAPVKVGTQHYLRNSNVSGNHDIYFNYGATGDIPLYCDWNGDGKDTVGVFRKGAFYLSDTNGAANYSFSFGNPDDIPVCGDWNNDGKDTIGLYRSSNATFYLRNTNSGGGSDATFGYGSPGDKPVAGDWNNDGTDTVGIVRGTTYYLRNTNNSGVADITASYGDPGDTRLVGDWDGNGSDTPGLWRKGLFYLRNSNSSGGADLTVSYGSPTDYPVVGDFDGNKTTTIGIVRP